MYNIEELRKEKESCRKKIITFSILTAVAAFLIILTFIVYVVSLVAIIENSSDVEAMTLLAVVLFVVVETMLTFAMCAFVPFIVINGIKHGKRRRLLNKIDNDEVVING